MIKVEWTINNFSYWNGYVHDQQIECPGSDFAYCPRIILFPKGLNGCDERLVVRVYVLPDESSDSSTSSGHTFCIYASGSLLYEQEIDEKMRKGDYYELYPMLKFIEVAAKIKKNEIVHQNCLVLGYDFKWKYERTYRMYTSIDLFDWSLKIDYKMVEKLGSEFIITIQYPQDDCNKAFEHFIINGRNTRFSISPTNFQKKIFVSTFTSVLKRNSVTRTEENEHVFDRYTDWVFFDSLSRVEVEEERLSLILRIKIVPSNKYRHHYGHGTGTSKEIVILPTHIFSRSTSSVLEGTSEELVSQTDIFLSRSNKSLVDVASNKPENPVTALSKELLCLYQDQEFSDFELRCGEISIPTHKNILSARSPVFKALLSSDMKEADSSSMDIPDLDVHTLGRFLIFLYSGVLDDLQWEEALKLYYAADKYQVCTLKKLCSELFLENVSVSNVCDILSLADKHQDDELAKTAHNFILKNYNDVLRSDGWKTFMIRDSLLAVKTVTYLAEKNSFIVAN